MNRQAVKNTAKIAAISTGIGIGVAVAFELIARLDPRETAMLGVAAAAGILIYLLKIVYDNECVRLQAEENIRRIEKKIG